MHIKEAGQQSLTPAIDVLCVAWNLGIRRWTNCCYAVAANNDGLILQACSILGIKEPNVFHSNR